MTSLHSRLIRLGLAAALFIPLLTPESANADGAPVAAATDEQKSKAQKLFTDASAKADVGEHSDALAGFEASFEVVASPNAKLMIGRQLLALERWVLAYEAFDATIDLAAQSADPKYEKTATTAREFKAEISRKVGLVRVDVGGRSLSVSIGGKQLSAKALSSGVAVTPGPVTVVFDGEGGRTSQSATAVAGKETTVTFDTGAPKSPTPTDPGNGQPTDPNQGNGGGDPKGGNAAALPLMATGGVLLGVGAAGIIVFAAFGVTTLKTSSELETSCPGNLCTDPADRAKAEDAKTEQLVANVGAGVGFAAAAVGLGLLIPGIIVDGDSGTNAATLHVGPTGASFQLHF